MNASSQHTLDLDMLVGIPRVGDVLAVWVQETEECQITITPGVWTSHRHGVRSHQVVEPITHVVIHCNLHMHDAQVTRSAAPPVPS